MKYIIGIGSLLGAATIALLVSNANAGDRVLLVRYSADTKALTGPQTTAIAGAINSVFGISAVSIDRVSIGREVKQNCNTDTKGTEDPGDDETTCVDVEVIGIQAVDLETLTPTQFYAAKDAGKQIKLLRKNGQNGDTETTYYKVGLTGPQRTGFANWLNSVWGGQTVETFRALTCSRAGAVVTCDLAKYVTLSPEAALDAEAAGSVLQDLGVVAQ